MVCFVVMSDARMRPRAVDERLRVQSGCGEGLKEAGISADVRLAGSRMIRVALNPFAVYRTWRQGFMLFKTC